MSDTRWSARVEAVKPFAAYTLGIKEAFNELKSLKLTPETKRDIAGLEMYLESFECILIASIWLKILTAINTRTTILQARKATFNVEVDNIEGFLNELQVLRDSWPNILLECKLVAENLNLNVTFPDKRLRKRATFHDETPDETTALSNEKNFRINVFNVIIDNVRAELSERFCATKNINSKFKFLWLFERLHEEELVQQCKLFLADYGSDVSQELVEEMKQFK